MSLSVFWKKYRLKLSFFALYYVVIGTSSIWLPAILYHINWEDLAIGILTIVLSITGYASTEKVLSLQSKDKKIEVLINISAVVIPLLVCVITTKMINSGMKWFSLSISIILYVLSCVLWWYQNRDNKTLDESTDALGGGTNQFN